jgi:cytochrome c oxidase subunit 3
VLLGLLFTGVQVLEYVHAGFQFTATSMARASSWRPASTASTCIIGTIFLIVCLIRATAGQLTPKHHLGFEFAAWYWHFVDVVWLFLFAAIYVWGIAGSSPRCGRA